MVGILKSAGNGAYWISQLNGEFMSTVGLGILGHQLFEPGSELVYLIVYERDDWEIFSPSEGC